MNKKKKETVYKNAKPETPNSYVVNCPNGNQYVVKNVDDFASAYGANEKELKEKGWKIKPN
ncbi:hypothetical protein [Neptunicoccus sediminis]|uniref:hypothetical protein n=1 Tax=Neptunicoccus sediminis TaxID=1892596 RepID=UPI00084620B6|nr:hypothetical protein [Neptunicoccus sediminis]